MPSGSATIRWNMNSEPDLAGYKLYHRTSIFVPYGAPTDVGLTDSTGSPSVTVSGLQSGLTHYFVVSAYDESGNESLVSAQVSKLVSVPLTTIRRTYK